MESTGLVLIMVGMPIFIVSLCVLVPTIFYSIFPRNCRVCGKRVFPNKASYTHYPELGGFYSYNLHRDCDR